MKKTAPCKICALPSNDNLQSALGMSPVCLRCFENYAELPETLHQATVEAQRTKVRIAPAIKANITIHAGEGLYEPLAEWYRKSSFVPVVIAPPEPDPELDDVMERIRNIRRRLDEQCAAREQEAKKKKWRLFSWIRAAFEPSINFEIKVI